jgi:hypothetical protein
MTAAYFHWIPIANLAAYSEMVSIACHLHTQYVRATRNEKERVGYAHHSVEWRGERRKEDLLKIRISPSHVGVE